MRVLIGLFIVLFSFNAFAATCLEYKRVYETKNIISTGTFKHQSEAVAINLATTMALNDAAKQAGTVLQKEDTTLYNDKVHMIIETKASNLIHGYQVLDKSYDPATGRAEVTIKVQGKVLAEELCKLLKIY